LKGSLQSALRNLPPEHAERLERYLRIGGEQVALLGSLVQDLSDVVRVQSGELRIERAPLDLVELAHMSIELTETMAEQGSVQLEAPSSPLVIDGDRRRLLQVMLNLISNAAQHGPSDQGTLVRLRAERDAATIEVIDHGPGIPNADRERVFERLYTTESRGRGLGVGLYLTQAIVAAHGGTIQLAPTERGGTTFVVRLPRQPDSS
jgi:signal transduction histidine kinase